LAHRQPQNQPAEDSGNIRGNREAKAILREGETLSDAPHGTGAGAKKPFLELKSSTNFPALVTVTRSA
jgi:hypothetical protein